MNSSKTKTTLMILVTVVILLLLYFYFEGGAPSQTGGLVTVAGGDANSIGSAELSLLNQISSLKIETDLFKDPVYQTFLAHDYSVQIAPQGIGRPYPFAPIPGVIDTSPTPAK